MSVVGFDFGSKNCVIATIQKGGIDVVANEASKRQTPNTVSFLEKQRAIGMAAQAKQIMNWRNTVAATKRLLGRRHTEASLRAELPSITYCPIKELDGGKFQVEVTCSGKKEAFYPEQLAAMVLRHLASQVNDRAGVVKMDAVISCPGYWNEQHRRALLDATAIAGLNCLKISNDLTAAAVDWGFYKTKLTAEDHQNVLFIDVGAAQMGCSVVEFTKDAMKVKASAYDSNLGGTAFDIALATHFAKKFHEKYSDCNVLENKKAWLRLLASCEKLKKVLSANAEAPIVIECLMNDRDLRFRCTRDEYEGLVSHLIASVSKPITDCLESAGLKAEELFTVELCGSGVRNTLVKKKIEETLGRKPKETINFEESVAKGCALQCALLSPQFRVRDYKIEDISPSAVTLSWHTINDPADTKVSKLSLFKENNLMPNPKNITFKRKGCKPFALTASYTNPEKLVEGTEPVIATFEVPHIRKPHHGDETAEIRVKINMTEHGTVQGVGANLKELYSPPPSPEPKKKAKKEVKKEAKKEDKKDDAKKEGENKDEPTPMDVDDKPAEGEAKKESKVEEPTPMEVEEPKPKAPKPKQIRWTALEFKMSPLGFSPQELTTLIKKEKDLMGADAAAVLIQNAKNNLESYCYDARDKLSMSWKEFAKAEENDNLRTMTMEIEDWLYDEGEDETKEVYDTKLATLKSIGDCIDKRRTEFEARQPALDLFYRTVENYSALAKSTDEKYSHITEEDRAKVEKECQEASASINTKVEEQNKKDKTDDPVLLAADVHSRQKNLNSFCAGIMNKAKPPPPKKEEPKKEEPKKDEAKPEAAAADATPEATPEANAEPAAKPEEPKDDPMDTGDMD